MSPVRPWAIALPVLLLLGWLCIEAYREGAADTLVAEANQSQVNPAWARSQPSLEAWLAVRNELLRARDLAPDNPSVFESLGVLHARRSVAPEFMVYAREYLVHSLELRPSSPYTWANFAEVQYLLGDTGKRFEKALVRTSTLGPWEPEVQRLVADLGLAVLNEVESPTRAEIERMVGFGMRRNPVDILQIAERRGRLDTACRYVHGNRRITDPKWSKRCERWSTT